MQPEQELSSRGFTKLDSGIVFSSVWGPEHDTVRVWIALLALCDARGAVRSSVPALARLCFIEVPRLTEILNEFQSPDPYSRIKEHGGRKIKEIDGGWTILNYGKYRKNMLQRKPLSHAERQKRYRERLRGDGAVTDDDEAVTSKVTEKSRKPQNSVTPTKENVT
jgi:hypothetical protein